MAGGPNGHRTAPRLYLGPCASLKGDTMRICHYAEVTLEDIGDTPTDYRLGINAEIFVNPGSDDPPEIGSVPLSVNLVEGIDWRMGDKGIPLDPESPLEFAQWLWNAAPNGEDATSDNANRFKKIDRVQAMALVLEDFVKSVEERREHAEYYAQTAGHDRV